MIFIQESLSPFVDIKNAYPITSNHVTLSIFSELPQTYCMSLLHKEVSDENICSSSLQRYFKNVQQEYSERNTKAFDVIFRNMINI